VASLLYNLLCGRASFSSLSLPSILISHCRFSMEEGSSYRHEEISNPPFREVDFSRRGKQTRGHDKTSDDEASGFGDNVQTLARDSAYLLSKFRECDE
jgi:hypothetical protein